MKKITRIQRFTLILVFAAVVWEIAVRIWMMTLPEHDPVIRVDLVIIIPVLAFFITISIMQAIQKNRTSMLFLVLLLSIMACKKKEQPASESKPTESEQIEPDSESPVSEMTTELKTRSGKSFVIETRAESGSLMHIAISPKGFDNSDETWTLDGADPLSGSFLADLDGNDFEELYLITTSAGSGSYATLYGYASNRDLSATPIYVPEISEEDLKEGGRFEGYMGHDSIFLEQGRLYRKFPVYLEGDENCCPTGGHRQIEYELVAGEATWVLKGKVRND